jgi:anti-sigma regulatory factor (Ser/Thr protein kinase)
MTTDQDRRGDTEPMRTVPGQQPGRYRCRTLPRDYRAAERARHATREALAAWQLDRLADPALLLVSELVTNAVRHAAAGDVPVTLTLRARGIWLRIEVQDGDPNWPRPRVPAGLEESGFGLVLVDAMASKWGVGATATGKSVWAELDTR